MNRDDLLIYSISGLPSLGSYRPVPEPAPWRRCNRACCGEPVRFTTYCLMCGFPEDLCPTRLDKLRLPPSNGHNEYTHCPRCPPIVGMTIVPATGYPDTDWAQFEDAFFCVPDILQKAGAAAAWPKVHEFMQRSGLTTWGTFLSNFEQYVNHIGAENFNQVSGHGDLGRRVLGHLLLAEAHELLFRRLLLCFDTNYVNPASDNLPQSSPHSFPGGRHEVPLMTVLLRLDAVVRQYTARTARAFMPLDMLVLKVMAQLVRPGRMTCVEKTDDGYVLTDSKNLSPLDEVPDYVVGKATCPSMHEAGSCWLGEELRLKLEKPFTDFPADGIFSALPLPFIGPLFA